MAESPPPTFHEHLRNAAVSRETIDHFLDPDRPSWATFDPVTGYRLSDFLPRDGVDGSSTISTYGPSKARTRHLYVEQPCRINTYGNSFTQCHQVSDGETWQEYLAAHLGEPIRNFGVGSFGVYQAYRRLIEIEESAQAAPYVVLYVWGDDHIRSLVRCRFAQISRWWDGVEHGMFHGNFWANIALNLATGELEERENILATPESVYQMTDPEWMAETLHDDLALQMSLFAAGDVSDIDTAAVAKLAGYLGASTPSSTPSREAVQELLDTYSLAATKHILAKTREFCAERDKELLVVLFDPFRVLRALVEDRPRCDEPIVAYLREEGFRSFDMNVVHVEDFAQFAIPYESYLDRYFIGHYNPTGNHFFAHSLKPVVVDWLDPRPITYEETDRRWLSFENYLRS